jgi:ATP-binding cassette, subfamily B, bacterial HlyB/CyaB
VDVNDGHISGSPGPGPHSVSDTGGGADIGAPTTGDTADGAPIHPRLLAMIVAGRYHGMELDPSEFRAQVGEKIPSPASLSAWAQGAGMWSRAVRLRWRHLMHFHNTGPVVLLFTDGTAGLLTGVNTEHKVVLLQDPRVSAAEAPVPLDELRLA